MIKVTKLNDAELVVNAELIEFVEKTPDTMISLVTGKKVMVKETPDQIIERVTRYRRQADGRIQSPLLAVDSAGGVNG